MICTDPRKMAAAPSRQS